MELHDVQKLAKLARIDIPEAEQKAFLDNLQSILDYVGQIKEVATKEKTNTVGTVYNSVRDDEVAHNGGEYTDAILQEAPDTSGGFFKVKQIL
jgi:aspartyl-tRNA(Asn)/glutamyl-tRNA(Gln) amidotransferase subunit C